MIKFKKGDKVKVMLGKDSGRDGVVEKVLPKKGAVVVANLNIYKKHVKGVTGQKGGIYDIPRPLSFAKVALVCPKCKKVTRVGIRMVGGKKERFCKKCDRVLDSKKK